VEHLRYGKLVEDIDNDFTKGSKNYPLTVTSSYNLVVNYNNYQRPSGRKLMTPRECCLRMFKEEREI
jgi:hypothetical protein